MKIGEHYIPQYYLRGFSDKTAPSSIWVYEKGSEHISMLPIEKVAKKNNMWSKSVEENLARNIEEPANHVLAKIRNRELITRDDKTILTAYIVVMIRRVPAGLERTKAIYPEVREKVFINIKNDILKLIEYYPTKKDLFQKRLQELETLKEKYESQFTKELWYQNLRPDALPSVFVLVPKMTWIFLTAYKGTPFLTNDNPVFYFKSLGIGKPESELSFPISSEITLWATWNPKYVEYQYSPLNENRVRGFNRRTASFVSKYAYYSIEDNRIPNLISKNNWKLHRMQ
jgi:hypothetical protein